MESTHKAVSSDEMDMVGLVEKVLFFLKRFWKPICLFVLLGLALALTSYFISPRQYASRMLLQSRVLTNKEYIEIIESWRELVKDREYGALASLTSSSESLLSKLKKIKADEIQKLYIQNNPNGFYIDVVVTDTSALPALEHAIVSGLENSIYVRERVESKKIWFNQMIGNIQQEIAKLESTKSVIDSMIRHKNNGASPLIVDISSLNTQWVGLNEKLLSFREELRFTRAVQVVQDFSGPGKPESPKLLKSIFFGLAGGGFVGYLVAIFLYISHRLQLRTKMRRAHLYETAE